MSTADVVGDPFINTATKDPFASSADPFSGDPFGENFKQNTSSSPSFAASFPPKVSTCLC